MLHFSRKTEYALLALEHMLRKEREEGSVTSTREVSEAYHIPYPLLAKVMQRLAGKGLIKAIHGTKGGYILVKRGADITIVDIVNVFEGPVAVAECFREERITCPQWDGCLIKNPFYGLNRKIQELLAATTLEDLVGEKEPAPSSKWKEGMKLPVHPTEVRK